MWIRSPSLGQFYINSWKHIILKLKTCRKDLRLLLLFAFISCKNELAETLNRLLNAEPPCSRQAFYRRWCWKEHRWESRGITDIEWNTSKKCAFLIMIETSKWRRLLTLFRHLANQNLPALHLGPVSVLCSTGDKILKPQMKRNVVLKVTKTITVFACKCITIQEQQHLVKKSKEFLPRMDYLSNKLQLWMSGKGKKMLSNGGKGFSILSHACIPRSS